MPVCMLFFERLFRKLLTQLPGHQLPPQLLGHQQAIQQPGHQLAIQQHGHQPPSQQFSDHDSTNLHCTYQDLPDISLF